MNKCKNIFLCGAVAQYRPWPPRSRGFWIKIQWSITVCSTSLDEWSAHHRDLYLTTHTHTRHKHPYPWQDSNPQSQ